MGEEAHRSTHGEVLWPRDVLNHAGGVGVDSRSLEQDARWEAKVEVGVSRKAEAPSRKPTSDGGPLTGNFLEVEFKGSAISHGISMRLDWPRGTGPGPQHGTLEGRYRVSSVCRHFRKCG